MNDAKLDLLTTRCCSPMNTWVTVRGFLVMALKSERIEGQIAVLEELPVRVVGDGPAYLDTDCDRWVRRKIASLRKELSE